MENYIWNPWHGCTKYSEGCANCYVYRRDSSIGKDASIITKNAEFNLPIKKNRKGEYKIPSDSLVYTCMTSDFFIEQADLWRDDVWEMIKARPDLTFIIITKRIARFKSCIPEDWGNGYKNVHICCTVENQKQCDIRLPVFSALPIVTKLIICEPLLERIDFGEYLSSDISQVIVGGESGNNARICDYSWVLDIRRQCVEAHIPFHFKQTGAKFKKDGKLYNVPRKLQHAQAKKAKIDT